MDNKGILRGLAVVVGIGVLAFTAVFSFLYRSKAVTTHAIATDIEKLAAIFQNIDTQCGIISFDYQQNPINFLNVKTFTSSELGPMNLAHADKWQGPYVEDNPSVQGKEYMVVRTKKGYFITPGNGVRLPNGMVVGEDIVLNEDVNIAAMMHDPKALSFKDKALAAPLTFLKGVEHPDIWNIPD